jgi:hypothetical protein
MVLTIIQLTDTVRIMGSPTPAQLLEAGSH